MNLYHLASYASHSTQDKKNWRNFAASWSQLDKDSYMADGGKYRYRKHCVGVANFGDSSIFYLKNIPHYQHTNYNILNGGVKRWYKNVDKDIVQSETFNTLLQNSKLYFEKVEQKQSKAKIKTSPGSLRHINSIL